MTNKLRILFFAAMLGLRAIKVTWGWDHNSCHTNAGYQHGLDELGVI